MKRSEYYRNLYDLKKDPTEINNVAGKEEYKEIRGKLRKELSRLRVELTAERS